MSGGAPKILSSVSFAEERPEYIINSATSIPITASRLNGRETSIETPTETSITAVVIISLSESCAVASSASEFIFLPSLRLKRHIHSFTSIETARIISAAAEYSGIASPFTSAETDDLKSSPPTSRISIATIKADIYSILP